MRPMPRMPSLWPDTSNPRGEMSDGSPQRLLRTMRSPHEAPLAAPRMRSRAISAVAYGTKAGAFVEERLLSFDHRRSWGSEPPQQVAAQRIRRRRPRDYG